MAAGAAAAAAAGPLRLPPLLLAHCALLAATTLPPLGPIQLMLSRPHPPLPTISSPV
jgi:hypothetical protein